jgi:hypothetical protein
MTSEVMKKNEAEVDRSDAKTASQSGGQHGTCGFVCREKSFNAQFL